jgi:transposase
MITAGAEIQVLVATRPVDFRKQADGLAAIVQAALGADPFCGAVYVFRSKRMDRAKLLWWDGTGICLMMKRLQNGQFRWPPIEDGMIKLSAAQLSALLEGVAYNRVLQRIYEALYKGHDLTKPGFVRTKVSDLEIDKFRRALEALSFYCILAKRISWKTEAELFGTIERAFELLATKPPITKFAEDILVAVPYLMNIGREFRFIHKTFAEYFAAEFLAHSPDGERLLRQFQQSSAWRNFTTAFEYMFEISPGLARRVFSVPIARQLAQDGYRGHCTIFDMCMLTLEWAIYWSDGPRKDLLVPEHIPAASRLRAGVIEVSGRDIHFHVFIRLRPEFERTPEKS